MIIREKIDKFQTLLRASMKSEDTEEWLDVHFTRPIGLAFALFWHRFGVTPNSITILSIFLGVAAGVMFSFTDTLYNVVGVVLLMLANFCDSTDGQLARLTNQRSMKGRCLDGFAGDTWFFTIYLALVLRLWNEHIPFTTVPWGIGGLVLAAVAGLLSHSPQSSLSDYYRQIHLYFLMGKKRSELGSYAQEQAIVESLKGKPNVFWERAFHSNYQYYCRSQERRTPAFQRFHKALMAQYGSIELVPQELKERFLKGSRPLMPFTNLLTFNSRAILLYITCLLNCPWIYLLLEVTIYNFMYIYMHKKHEKLCASLIQNIGEERQTKPSVILFDFGGTLDTQGCHWGKMLWHGYETMGVSVTEEQFREAYVYAERKLGSETLIHANDTFRRMLSVKLSLEFNYLLEKGWLTVDEQSAKKMQTRLEDHLYNKVETTIGSSKNVLEQLRKRYRLGLVTNFYGNMSVVLNEFHLSNLFEVVTESAVVGVRKPSSEIFRKAVAAMQVEPRKVLVVGDSYTKDILPAHEIGCRTCWLKGEGWDKQEPEAPVADLIIHELKSLLAYT